MDFRFLKGTFCQALQEQMKSWVYRVVMPRGKDSAPMVLSPEYKPVAGQKFVTQGLCFYLTQQSPRNLETWLKKSSVTIPEAGLRGFAIRGKLLGKYITFVLGEGIGEYEGGGTSHVSVFVEGYCEMEIRMDRGFAGEVGKHVRKMGGNLRRENGPS